MAQRTGAERLLASPAKSTSARAILALVLAALLLAGCGGSSDDPQGTSSTSTSSSASGDGSSAAAAEKAGGPRAKTGQGSGAEAGPGGASAPGGAAAGSDPSASAGQKHGPRIAQPKGAPEQAPTPAEIANATVADMRLESPAITASAGAPGRLAAPYTCDGDDSWPELRWSGVPAGTAELALFVMNVQPVEEKLFVDWALAGLDPGLTEIQAGELPKGAIVGTNGFGKRGYELCPSGGGEIYMFAIYALPRELSPKQGFDARELRKEVLDLSGNVGLLPAVYERG